MLRRPGALCTLVTLSALAEYDEKSKPVADNLYIESATSISRCFIYDMEGCERFGHSGNISKIDVTPLPPGNYILRIVYDEKAKRRDDFFKVVVQ